MTIETLRALSARLGNQVNALVALGLALDARVSGRPLDAALQARVDEVLAAAGGAGILDGVSVPELAPLLAGVRHDVFNAKKALSTAPSQTWNYDDEEILQAVGDTSAGFAVGLQRMVAPALAGLAPRLESGGAFLDVGIGVASLSIAMARLWPSLRIVGIDPWAPSVALAKRNVERAGLAPRIEVRHAGAEALTDVDTFDLAWVPNPFIPGPLMPAVLARVVASLIRGGWLLFAVTNPGNEPLHGAVGNLKTTLWGGAVRSLADAEALLAAAGLVDVSSLPAQPTAAAAIVVGRKS